MLRIKQYLSMSCGRLVRAPGGEMIKECLVCGEVNKRWFAATVWHFRPIDWEQRRFLRGNFRTFGFWSGLRSNICLMFPFLNTLLNWKYRKHRLVFADGSELTPRGRSASWRNGRSNHWMEHRPYALIQRGASDR